MEHEGAFVVAERFVQSAVEWLRLGVELIGALVIAVGIVVAGIRFFAAFRNHSPRAYANLRLTLAHYLALALEFQLAADILSTAVAPTWDRIARLAAIAVIRTGLNFFLAKEVQTEEEHLGKRPDSVEKPRTA